MARPETPAHRNRLRFAAVAAFLALGTACYDFHLAGPEDAPEVLPPPTVTVTVEYRQPVGCINSQTNCEDLVVFFGSWMPTGEVLFLDHLPGSFVWHGTARAVPVNFPPRDEPYLVRVYDPHLRDAPGGGITASRLQVGGELLDHFDAPGTDRESALVFVDANGVGHDPY